MKVPMVLGSKSTVTSTARLSRSVRGGVMKVMLPVLLGLAGLLGVKLTLLGLISVPSRKTRGL